jgi:hypothetical protein
VDVKFNGKPSEPFFLKSFEKGPPKKSTLYTAYKTFMRQSFIDRKIRFKGIPKVKFFDRKFQEKRLVSYGIVQPSGGRFLCSNNKKIHPLKN